MINTWPELNIKLSQDLNFKIGPIWPGFYLYSACIYIYIYIYIYIWLWARLPPQILPFLEFFPQLYSKKWPKRDVANLPHLSIYVFGENDPKRAWDCSPKHLLKKMDTVTVVPGLFLGFKVIFAYVAKKSIKSQKC